MSKGGLFRNRYRNDTTRWQKWDYSASGAYFITICTKNRVHYFGSITMGMHHDVERAETRGVGTQNIASLRTDALAPDISIMRLAEIGKSAFDCWHEIPNHFPIVKLDEFVVMPNHVHGIIWIVGTEIVRTQNIASPQRWKPNQFGPQSMNIPSIIRGYKIGVTKYANQIHLPFAWQPRYYDHIIRNEFELNRIRMYIRNNPKKWAEDSLFTE